MLRHALRSRHRRMSQIGPTGHGLGPEGRINKLRKFVTSLIRYERIETIYEQCDEVRGYTECLIHLAMKNGNRHQETMSMCDFWILEKDLIPKLFEVIAPRYQNCHTSFTSVYKLPIEYPGDGRQLAVLELKGNPWPPVLPKKRDFTNVISNILLEEAKKDYQQQHGVTVQQRPSYFEVLKHDEI